MCRDVKSPRSEVKTTMKECKECIAETLRNQGLEDLSDETSNVVSTCALEWTVADNGSPEEAETIAAFSFGYRIDPNGNRRSGPINDELAEVVVKHYNSRPRRVFAQWEISEAIGNRIPESDLVTIFPQVDKSTGTVRYLSTKDVLSNVRETREKQGTVSDSGPLLVIAHRDHLFRCVQEAKRAGFKVISAQEEMPSAYDLSSGQPWTTSRRRYLISDMISRLASYRQDVLYKAAPRSRNGSSQDVRVGLLAEFPALRNEINVLLRIRFQLTIFAIIALGALLSIGVQLNVPAFVPLMYPPFAFFLAVYWAHTDLRIGQIGEYVRGRIAPRVPGLGWEEHLRETYTRSGPQTPLKKLPRLPHLSSWLFVCTSAFAGVVGGLRLGWSFELSGDDLIGYLLLVVDSAFVCFMFRFLGIRESLLYKK